MSVNLLIIAATKRFTPNDVQNEIRFVKPREAPDIDKFAPKMVKELPRIARPTY